MKPNTVLSVVVFIQALCLISLGINNIARSHDLISQRENTERCLEDWKWSIDALTGK